MKNRPKKKIEKSQLIKTVASSSAIETGESIQGIQDKLTSKAGKFKHLTLAQ